MVPVPTLLLIRDINVSFRVVELHIFYDFHFMSVWHLLLVGSWTFLALGPVFIVLYGSNLYWLIPVIGGQ